MTELIKHMLALFMIPLGATSLMDKDFSKTGFFKIIDEVRIVTHSQGDRSQWFNTFS